MTETTKPTRKSAEPKVEPEAQPTEEAKPVYVSGYYRTAEQKVVKRTYLGTDGDYSQHNVQGPNGELPEGLENKDIIDD